MRSSDPSLCALRPSSDGISGFQVGQILHPCHRSLHARVASEEYLKSTQFGAKLLTLGYFVKSSRQTEPMPFRCKRTDNLIEHNHCDFREFLTIPTMYLDNSTRKPKESMYALKCGLLIRLRSCATALPSALRLGVRQPYG